VGLCPSAREKFFLVGNIRKTPLKELVTKETLRSLWGITLDDVADCRDANSVLPAMTAGLTHICIRVTSWKSPYCLYEPKKGIWMKAGEKNLDI
jgi:hypothetical protein